MKKCITKIATICVMTMLVLSFAACGIGRQITDNIVDNITDNITEAVGEVVTTIVQEATAMAFDEMGGGPAIVLGAGSWDAHMSGDLYVRLVNNAISIQTHAEDTVRFEFSPPTTGEYVIPVAEFNRDLNRHEITEPPSNITLGGDNRPGVLFIFVPMDMVAFTNMELRTTNGAARIIGNGEHLTNVVTISIGNGIVELRDFDADIIIANATNGTISGNGLGTSALEARTTNGVVTLRDSQVSGNLTARTSTGSVTLERVDFDRDRSDLNAGVGILTVR